MLTDQRSTWTSSADPAAEVSALLLRCQPMSRTAHTHGNTPTRTPTKTWTESLFLLVKNSKYIMLKRAFPSSSWAEIQLATSFKHLWNNQSSISCSVFFFLSYAGHWHFHSSVAFPMLYPGITANSHWYYRQMSVSSWTQRQTQQKNSCCSMDS